MYLNIFLRVNMPFYLVIYRHASPSGWSGDSMKKVAKMDENNYFSVLPLCALCKMLKFHKTLYDSIVSL